MKGPVKSCCLRIAIALLLVTACALSQSTIDLAGSWRFKADSGDVGIQGQWFLKQLPEKITLPGSMARNGKGDDISVNTKWTGGIVDKSWFTEKKYEKYRQPGNVKVPFWLNPVKSYVGAAWYQKQVDVPKGWQGKHVELFLERCHWETQLWVDGQEVGTQNSLATPHRYDLSGMLVPGKHRLTLRVDNRIKDIDVGYNAHSVSDHTQTNWNGIVGRIELRASPTVFISDVSLVPNIQSKRVDVSIELATQTRSPAQGRVILSVNTVYSPKKQTFPERTAEFEIQRGRGEIHVAYPMGEEVRLWDEFEPSLYQMHISLRSAASEVSEDRTIQFGMREFKVEGTRFSVNGRPIFLRGTLECAIFPKTGYASMDIRDWKRIFRVSKSFGLNHVRFHSWCPPEVAFDAADQEGIYLYVECCAWTTVGDGKPFDKWLYQESESIVQAYGNHPSFCMMSYGNEPGGANQSKFLGEFVKYWKEKDARRVYTGGAGWPQIPESDFHITDAPRIQRWGAGLTSIINSQAPQTAFDFRDIISKYDKPVVSHEIGQWCVYPNFNEIKKYTGVLKAKNFEVFKESLGQNHMGEQAKDFLLASGKLQVLCYKADIEAALRTPGMAGFELLDLHDFPGQGTALVGVLDAFWGGKGYVTAKEYLRFCNSTVPIVRMKKRIFLNNEELAADVEVAHFGRVPLRAVTPTWRIKDTKGTVVASGSLKQTDVPVTNAFSLGSIRAPLAAVQSAAKLILEVSIAGYSNEWDVWVYPATLPDIEMPGVVVANEINAEVENALEAGKSVLLLADTGHINSSVPPGFSSIFWNTAWTSGQPPHTLGILCNPQHPALKYFPTEYHSNWQWWDLITKSRAMVLDSLPASLRPVVQVVDDWFTNRKLGLLLEAKVGKGKLLLCSIDLKTDLEERPVARQLLLSLRRYVASSEFGPKQTVSLSLLRKLFKGDEATDSAR